MIIADSRFKKKQKQSKTDQAVSCGNKEINRHRKPTTIITIDGTLNLPRTVIMLLSYKKEMQ